MRTNCWSMVSPNSVQTRASTPNRFNSRIFSRHCLAESCHKKLFKTDVHFMQNVQRMEMEEYVNTKQNAQTTETISWRHSLAPLGTRRTQHSITDRKVTKVVRPPDFWVWRNVAVPLNVKSLDSRFAWDLSRLTTASMNMFESQFGHSFEVETQSNCVMLQMAVVQGGAFNEPPLITRELSAGQFQRPKENLPRVRLHKGRQVTKRTS